MNERDVLITGLGLVSSLGEGPDAHWQALTAPDGRPVIDSERYAPYTIHPLPAIDWNLQIPKRGDQRQMETWQRLGTYAAGLALDDSGLKQEAALCASMDLVVAAGAGERDEAVDAEILESSPKSGNRDALLNEKLSNGLRPTLFLAQLANLLAGNISIVHQVTGSSRTFMGEDGAGIAAIENAVARIRAGQSTHMLVGGAYQCEHSDLILGYELGGYLHQGPWKPVWQRDGSPGGGVVPGSGGAFLVLESRAHAQARGAGAYARIDTVVSDRIRRSDGALEAGLASMLARVTGADAGLLAISGASGAHAATAAERSVFDETDGAVARAFSTRIGHLKEAQFPFAVALAALALKRQSAYPAFDGATEAPFEGKLERAIATTVGYHLYEGMASVVGAE